MCLRHFFDVITMNLINFNLKKKSSQVSMSTNEPVTDEERLSLRLERFSSSDSAAVGVDERRKVVSVALE